MTTEFVDQTIEVEQTKSLSVAKMILNKVI